MAQRRKLSWDLLPPISCHNKRITRGNVFTAKLCAFMFSIDRLIESEGRPGNYGVFS